MTGKDIKILDKLIKDMTTETYIDVKLKSYNGYLSGMEVDDVLNFFNSPEEKAISLATLIAPNDLINYTKSFLNKNLIKDLITTSIKNSEYTAFDMLSFFENESVKKIIEAIEEKQKQNYRYHVSNPNAIINIINDAKKKDEEQTRSSIEHINNTSKKNP